MRDLIGLMGASRSMITKGTLKRTTVEDICIELQLLLLLFCAFSLFVLEDSSFSCKKAEVREIKCEKTF